MTDLTGSWRIRAGAWTASELTDAYEVKRLPIQSDHRSRWLIPDDSSAPFSESAEDVESLGGSWGEYGGIEFTWSFTALTPKQVKYLRDTFFVGGRYTDAITVMTWNRAGGDDGEWMVVTCKAHMRNPARTATAPASGWSGYDKVLIDFYDGEIASSGLELLLENGFALLLENGDILNLEG